MKNSLYDLIPMILSLLITEIACLFIDKKYKVTEK